MRITPEQVNAWRVVPRIAIGIYFYLWIISTFWFFELENPNNAQSIFIAAVWGAAPVFFGFYVNTGGNKNAD